MSEQNTELVTMTEEQIANLDFDSLLDMDLNELADLQKYELPAPGYCRFHLKAEPKEINGKRAVEFSAKILEVLEAKNPEDPPKVGAVASESFFLNNAISIGKMKEFLKQFAEPLGTTSIRGMMEVLQAGVEINAVLTHRAGKKKEGSDTVPMYAQFSQITVA